MAADGNGGGGIAAVRPPPPFSQAAGPSGGNWLLQGRLAASLAAVGLSGGCRSIWRQVLAAAGPLQGRYTRPPFNGAAAAASSCLQAYCFLLAWLQTRTRMIQNYNLAFVY